MSAHRTPDYPLTEPRDEQSTALFTDSLKYLIDKVNAPGVLPLDSETYLAVQIFPRTLQNLFNSIVPRTIISSHHW